MSGVEKLSFAGVRVTVSGIAWLTEYAIPLCASVTVIDRLSVVELPMAAVLPERLTTQRTAPHWFTEGWLNEAVTPLGNPDTIVTLVPDAPVGTVTPPTGCA